jgi:hypothetical protein
MKDFFTEVVVVIRDRFYLAKESQEYLLQNLMVFVNLAFGTRGLTRKEAGHRPGPGGRDPAAAPEDQEVHGAAPDRPELDPGRQAQHGSCALRARESLQTDQPRQ